MFSHIICLHLRGASRHRKGRHGSSEQDQRNVRPRIPAQAYTCETGGNGGPHSHEQSQSLLGRISIVGVVCSRGEQAGLKEASTSLVALWIGGDHHCTKSRNSSEWLTLRCSGSEVRSAACLVSFLCGLSLCQGGN